MALVVYSLSTSLLPLDRLNGFPKSDLRPVRLGHRDPRLSLGTVAYQPLVLLLSGWALHVTVVLGLAVCPVPDAEVMNLLDSAMSRSGYQLCDSSLAQDDCDSHSANKVERHDRQSHHPEHQLRPSCHYLDPMSIALDVDASPERNAGHLCLLVLPFRVTLNASEGALGAVELDEEGRALRVVHGETRYGLGEV